MDYFQNQRGGISNLHPVSSLSLQNPYLLRGVRNTLSMGVSDGGSAKVQQTTTPDQPIGKLVLLFHLSE